MSKQPLLEVKNLVTEFRTDNGTVRAVDGVSFTLHRGETISTTVNISRLMMR